MAGLPTPHTFQAGDKVHLSTSYPGVVGFYLYYDNGKETYINMKDPITFQPSDGHTYTLVEGKLESQTKTSTSPNPSPRSNFRLITPVPDYTRTSRNINESEIYERGISHANLITLSGQQLPKGTLFKRNDVVLLKKALPLKIVGGGLRHFDANQRFVVVGEPRSMSSGRTVHSTTSLNNTVYDVRLFRDLQIKGDTYWKSSEHHPVSAFVKA